MPCENSPCPQRREGWLLCFPGPSQLCPSFVPPPNGLPFCPPELVATAASNIGEGRCTALTTEGVMWQTIIHIVFILSAIGIAWTDKLMPAGNGKGKSAH